LVESAHDVGGGHPPHSGRGQLDGQRDVIETLADLDHGGLVELGHHQTLVVLRGALPGGVVHHGIADLARRPSAHDEPPPRPTGADRALLDPFDGQDAGARRLGAVLGLTVSSARIRRARQGPAPKRAGHSTKVASHWEDA
jgi:hypothetical protein